MKRRHFLHLAVWTSCCLGNVPALQAQVPCFVHRTAVRGPADIIGLSLATNGDFYYVTTTFSVFSASTLGVIENATGQPKTLVSGLHEATAVEAAGDKVYFTEGGTVAGQFRDGTLSVFHLPAGGRTLLRGGLHYPRSIFVDNSGSVYVLEGAGSSTSFGGNNRLIRFAPGATQYQVVIPYIPTPTAVVVNSQGTIFVGSFGQTIPGDTGTLLAYAQGNTNPVTVVSNLTAVLDLAIDKSDNLYLAGFGDQNPVGLAFLPRDANQTFPLPAGKTIAWVSLDPAGNVFYPIDGLVTVGELALCPPEVRLVSPTNGWTFLAPADIRLAASASSSNGTIAKVEFFVGDSPISLLGEVPMPPYVYEWMGVPPGNYSLRAKATDDAGRESISSPIYISIISREPKIGLDPTSQSVLEGTAVSFTSSAVGAAPLRYQWRFNGNSMAGQTDTTLIIPSAQLGDEGDYDLHVSNAFGTATSTAASLSVTPRGPLDRWHPRTQPAPAARLNGITFANGLFVAVGQSGGGAILTSPDGVTWTPRHSGTPNPLKAIAYGNGIFVAVGDEGGGGAIVISPDGITWTNIATGVLPGLNAVTWGGGRFVAVGYDGSTLNTAIVTSTDAIGWNRLELGEGITNAGVLNGVAFGDGQFLAASFWGNILSSVDGLTWTNRGPTGGFHRAVAYGNGIWIVAGGPQIFPGGAGIYASSDLISWMLHSVPGGGPNYYPAVAFGSRTFAVVGNWGNLAYSQDAAQWTLRDVGGMDAQLSSIAYGNGTFVAVGPFGAILQSDDIRMTRLSLRGIADGGFRFAITGEAGQTFHVQASDNLVATQWTNLLTFTSGAATTHFVDSDAGHFSRRFYRVVSP